MTCQQYLSTLAINTTNQTKINKDRNASAALGGKMMITTMRRLVSMGAKSCGNIIRNY
jgi:hypothetical protein